MVGIGAARVHRADGVHAGDEGGDGQRLPDAQRVVAGVEAAHRQHGGQAGFGHLRADGGSDLFGRACQEGGERSRAGQAGRHGMDMGVDHSARA